MILPLHSLSAAPGSCLERHCDVELLSLRIVTRTQGGSAYAVVDRSRNYLKIVFQVRGLLKDIIDVLLKAFISERYANSGTYYKRRCFERLQLSSRKLDGSYEAEIIFSVLQLQLAVHARRDLFLWHLL